MPRETLRVAFHPCPKCSSKSRPWTRCMSYKKAMSYLATVHIIPDNTKQIQAGEVVIYNSVTGDITHHIKHVCKLSSNKPRGIQTKGLTKSMTINLDNILKRREHDNMELNHGESLKAVPRKPRHLTFPDGMRPNK